MLEASVSKLNHWRGQITQQLLILAIKNKTFQPLQQSIEQPGKSEWNDVGDAMEEQTNKGNKRCYFVIKTRVSFIQIQVILTVVRGFTSDPAVCHRYSKHFWIFPIQLGNLKHASWTCLIHAPLVQSQTAVALVPPLVLQLHQWQCGVTVLHWESVQVDWQTQVMLSM